jgi:hypothetical protein
MLPADPGAALRATPSPEGPLAARGARLVMTGASLAPFIQSVPSRSTSGPSGEGLAISEVPGVAGSIASRWRELAHVRATSAWHVAQVSDPT